MLTKTPYGEFFCCPVINQGGVRAELGNTSPDEGSCPSREERIAAEVGVAACPSDLRLTNLGPTIPS